MIVHNKHLTVQEQWSNDRVLYATVFDDVMPRERYVIILSMLNFYDNNLG